MAKKCQKCPEKVFCTSLGPGDRAFEPHYSDQNPSEIVDFRGILVRVVRLERTVSWSQTRRDTNFAIPGYSLFCHDTTARGKNKDFSVCGHSCGQSRFYAIFGNRWKSRKRRCHKALRRFVLPCSGYRHGALKRSALSIGLPLILRIRRPHPGGVFTISAFQMFCNRKISSPEPP